MRLSNCQFKVRGRVTETSFLFCVRYKFKSLQHCLCAGEPINPEVMKKWREATGLDIYEGYGQTETVSGLNNNQV